MKKLVKSAIIILTLLLTGCDKTDNNQINIVTTIFPGYDIAKVVGEKNVNVKMLLKPGSESHSYDPTPKDIIDIRNSDIFIYNGGESEEWVEDVLIDISPNTKVIKLMDLVVLKEEEIIEGMQHVESDHDHEDSNHEHHDEEYDEHVWTSPINYIKFINEFNNQIQIVDKKNSEIYEKNANEYIVKLTKLDALIRSIVSESKNKELIFGDRFPFRYFVDEYNLTYRAAFPGCSEDTEASAKTIAYLIDYVQTNQIPVVFHLELSNQKITNTIIETTSAKKLEFHSAHNVSKNEFESGVTYYDIMKKNVENLKEALK